MKYVSTFLMVAMASCVGACSHYSEELSYLDRKMGGQQTIVTAAPQDIAPAAGADTSFGEMLARDYYAMARYENDTAYDYKAAKLFTEKAASAAAGQVTAPSRVSAYSIPSRKIPELNEARNALLAALKEQNLPGNETNLAKAQTSFDCWLERTEEARDESHYTACREAYETAMAQLVAPAAGMVPTDLPVVELAFPQNSTVIGPDLLPALDEIAAFLSSEKGKTFEVYITGYVGGNNPSDSGRQLAKSRALVINQALVQRGVYPYILKPQIAGTSSARITLNVKPFGAEAVRENADLVNVVHVHFVDSRPPAETVKKAGE